MATTYNELIEEARRQVRLVPLDELRRRLEARAPMVLVDVREREETRAGTLPGALIVPRGFLEMQIEQKVPDKGAHVVLYCAGGVRSALAAKHARVSSATRTSRARTPASCAGRSSASPSRLPPAQRRQRERYSRHLLLPEVGEKGQAKLLVEGALLGAGGLGSPAALYLAAAGVGTLGLVDADVVDASNLQRQVLHATSRVGAEGRQRERPSDLNPDVKVVKFEERLTSEQRRPDLRGLRRDRRRLRQLPDALPRERRLGLEQEARRAREHLPLRGAGDDVHPPRGPCYRCLYPEPPPRTSRRAAKRRGCSASSRASSA
jgi:rhodanese-related sulfurtransferase